MMKKQRIYIDTSVIGGCFDNEFATWSEGLMRDFAQGNFIPVTSELIATEIADAPAFVQDKFAELLSIEHEMLTVTDESLVLAAVYQERKILTPKFHNDGIHIALATVAEVDVMVSWNFKHIVNFNKIRLFNAANLEQGYRQIQIYTPREVTTYEDK
ncbi:MAG: hypothetical protein R2911_34455 [Caldilineaceae bacterium]